jgi:sigma-B regulation protein RsbU (phosphoserine phosphatase)
MTELARILVVDDDAAARAAVAASLVELGVELHEATDAPTGLQAARRLHPAVTVCEWVLAGGGGLGLCRAICEDADLTATRVVMLTSLADPRDAHTARQAGASAFLLKPAAPEELREVVRECLAGRRRFVRQAPTRRASQGPAG